MRSRTRSLGGSSHAFDQLGELRREKTDSGREKIVGGAHDDLALALSMALHFSGAAADMGLRARGRRDVRRPDAPSCIAWT
jgi:hypothetical protein